MSQNARDVGWIWMSHTLLETANIVENPPVSALTVYYNRYGLEAMALCPSRVKSRFIGLGWLCVLFVSQAALGVYCF